MKQTDLNKEWAWSQIEAMADDSLDGIDLRRMQAVMTDDDRLLAAVERARAMHLGLRQVAQAPIPPGMLWRLLGIAKVRSRRGFWIAAPVATAMAAVMVALFTTSPQTPPLDEQNVAVQEFTVAMAYLQRSLEFTNEEVTNVVSQGLRDAISVSRNALGDDEIDNETGDVTDE